MLLFKSEYSLLKSVCKLDETVKKAADLGIKNLAIADDNLFGAVKFYKLCKKYNIVPTFGLDVIIEGERRVFVAINNIGYANLIKLASLEFITRNRLEKLNFGFIEVRKNENGNFPICTLLNSNDEYLIPILNALRLGGKIPEQNGLTYTSETPCYVVAAENDVNFPACSVTLQLGEFKLPKFQKDGIDDNAAYFKKLCKNGFIKRYGDITPQSYVQRLMYEIGVIEKMGYIDYFLIVWDYVRFARMNDIAVGVGRGSGAGSMCAYCLGITGIDPMQYGLIFERFLNPERISMPDFDIDFCVVGRQKVIDYVVAKYRRENVAQILALSNMTEKTLTRDLKNIGLKERNSYKGTDYTIGQVVERLDGLPRHVSTHAAGVVITPCPTTDYAATMNHNGAILTQADMSSLEEIGLIKMDFLGLRNLTIIDKCSKQVRFDINNVFIHDRETYGMLSRGETTGVFQLESPGVTNLLTKMRPECIEDIMAATALFRPGPMDSIPKYLENKKNPRKIVYAHPLLKPILSETYGCIVYQEQVMEIFRTLAGYSYGGADMVRRAMSKKKHDVLARERGTFINGAAARGMNFNDASGLFDELEKFSAYAFNKSHAAAYAFIAYQTAYLKCHFPNDYLSAQNWHNIQNPLDYVTNCAENIQTELF